MDASCIQVCDRLTSVIAMALCHVTHCGLMTLYGDRDLDQQCLAGDFLLLNGTKPIPD